MALPRALASLSELEDLSARNMASVFSMRPKRHHGRIQEWDLYRCSSMSRFFVHASGQQNDRVSKQTE